MNSGSDGGGKNTITLNNPCKQPSTEYNWPTTRDSTCCGNSTDALAGCNTAESVGYNGLYDRIVAYTRAASGGVVEMTGYNQPAKGDKSYACNMIIPPSSQAAVTKCWGCCASSYPPDSTDTDVAKAYASCKVTCACPPIIVQPSDPSSLAKVRDYIDQQINQIMPKGQLPDLVVLRNWNCFPPLTHTITVVPITTFGGGGGVGSYYWIVIAGMVVLAMFFVLYKYT